MILLYFFTKILFKKEISTIQMLKKVTQHETFEKLKDFLITIFFDYKKPFPLSRHREFLPSRHCEPKGWQVCWHEAISSLLLPLSVKCFEGIASLTAFARNDVVGYRLAMT